MSSSNASQTEPKESYTLPNSQKMTIDELISTYKKHLLYLTPLAADVGKLTNSDSNYVEVQGSVKYLDQRDPSLYIESGIIDCEDSTINKIKWGWSSEVMGPPLTSAYSESRRFRASIKTKPPTKEKGNDQHIQLYYEGPYIFGTSIDSFEHGPIICDPRLGNVAFSPDERKIAYVAEKKVTGESFFKQPKDHRVNSGTRIELSVGWGEQIELFDHTCICVLTLERNCKPIIVDLPDQTLTQPFWIDNQTIGFVSYKESPKCLRLVPCFNRVSCLYKCSLGESKNHIDAIRGQNDDLDIINPQINRQKDKVFFFERQAGRTGSQRAMLWDLKNNEISTVFDYYEPQQPEIQSLFVQPISSNYWLSSGEHVVVSTIDHSKKKVLILGVLTGRVKMIDLPEPMGETTVLGLRKDILILRCSSPYQPPVVLVGMVNVYSSRPIVFEQNSSERSVRNYEVSYRIIKQEELHDPVETILIGSATTFDQPTPVIVTLHGGPHSVSIAEYNPTNLFFVELGFKVAHINYRGSMGISNDYVEQLLGHVGDIEVKDCISAIQNLIDLRLVDKANVHLFGSSFGGFLVCHLIAQYPEFDFASCTALNPVTDMSKMLGVADIPDWTLVETLGSEISTYKRLNNWPEENNLVKQLNRLMDIGPPEVLAAMFEKSPIKHVQKVQTPVMIVMSENDQGVPPQQGLRFANVLEKHGRKVKRHIYPDNYSFHIPSHKADFEMKVAGWILENLRRDDNSTR